MLRFDCFCLCILELLLTESRASDTSSPLNLRHMGRYQVRVNDNRRSIYCAYYFSARHNWCFSVYLCYPRGCDLLVIRLGSRLASVILFIYLFLFII